MIEALHKEPIRSRPYLDGAKGSRCTLNIPGVCNYDADTVVACHIRDGRQGTGGKADDLSVADGCSACHDAMDGRSGSLTTEEYNFHALRGIQRTLRRRHAQGLLRIDDDRPMKRAAPLGLKGDAKPKARASRPIPQRETPAAPPQRRASTPIKPKFEGAL